MMKPSNHVTNLPCFEQVAWAIGNANAQRELFKVASFGNTIWTDASKNTVSHAFHWGSSPQGYEFWLSISTGASPYEK